MNFMIVLTLTKANAVLSNYCLSVNAVVSWLVLQVNGKKIYQSEDGVHLTILDGHTGKVLETKGFRNAVLMGIPAQIENYIDSLKDE